MSKRDNISLSAMTAPLNEPDAWREIRNRITNNIWLSQGICAEIQYLYTTSLISRAVQEAMHARLKRHRPENISSGMYYWLSGEKKPRIKLCEELIHESELHSAPTHGVENASVENLPVSTQSETQQERDTILTRTYQQKSNRSVHITLRFNVTKGILELDDCELDIEQINDLVRNLENAVSRMPYAFTIPFIQGDSF